MTTQKKTEQRSRLQDMKRPKRGVPEGLWLRCDGCGATVFRNQVEENQNICPECDHHFYVPTSVRIRQLLDPDSFEEWYADQVEQLLKESDYSDKADVNVDMRLSVVKPIHANGLCKH